MNYIGSKFKLSHFLQTSIESTLQKASAKPLKDSIFCDIFAGTAAVGRLFKAQVKQIISNDREYYSFVLA
ncbi:DNA adenine methylase, partial [Helicobacter typhlonius]